MKLSRNVVSDSVDENNFLHKLILTNTQFSRLRKAFAKLSKLSKLSKTQLHKIGQSWDFLSRLQGPFWKNWLSLSKNVLKSLANSVLLPLELTAAAAATDTAIHKKIIASGNTRLITYNEEMNNIMKIIKSLEESALLIKQFSETIKNETKKQKGGFPGMLLVSLGARTY